MLKISIIRRTTFDHTRYLVRIIIVCKNVFIFKTQTRIIIIIFFMIEHCKTRRETRSTITIIIETYALVFKNYWYYYNWGVKYISGL